MLLSERWKCLGRTFNLTQLLAVSEIWIKYIISHISFNFVQVCVCVSAGCEGEMGERINSQVHHQRHSILLKASPFLLPWEWGYYNPIPSLMVIRSAWAMVSHSHSHTHRARAITAKENYSTVSFDATRCTLGLWPPVIRWYAPVNTFRWRMQSLYHSVFFFQSQF